MEIFKKILHREKKPQEKFYLTKQGLAQIRKGYQHLLEVKRAKVRGETPQFLHSDELNPEYLDLQNDLSLLDSRISDLEHIIENAVLIKHPAKNKRSIAQVGAKVLVKIDGQEDEFTIVGTLEANPSLGKISNESPVGQALLGHKVGDEVIISSPIKTHYRIKKITYPKISEL